MSDKVNEQLSACADDALPNAEMPLLLQRLVTDRDLQGRWSRYHLIGDALRDGLPARMDPAFADRVSGAIAAAPPIPVRHRVPWLRGAGGIAIAATVATVALLNFPVAEGPDPSVVVPVTANPQTPFSARVASTGAIQWERAQPEVQAQLNMYLQSHIEEEPPRQQEGKEGADNEDRK